MFFTTRKRRMKNNELRIIREILFKKSIFMLPLFFILHSLFLYPIHAVTDPLNVPNNKFGMHIISGNNKEASETADLVNHLGDWGYITVVIENKDKNIDKWQNFFNELRRKHLIPLVRIATQPGGDYWVRPDESEPESWAQFLDKLVWPTKNRYVIIYNEPNHATEWGKQVDPRGYAQVLDKTITALKNKNPDFFVMNAGFDASAPHQPPNYYDEAAFIREMNSEVPSIFDKLDGWSSHSYPNPGFIGSPKASGKGTVRTWRWELQLLKSLGVTKDLPIFITETGWKHSEGMQQIKGFPSPETVAGYYKDAFENAWNDPKIVAVTPFILSYNHAPFDHFSFKKPNPDAPQENILGTQFPDYYPQYTTLRDMNKVFGRPIQENKATITKSLFYNTIVAGETYDISLTFKNTGQSIWTDLYPIKLISTTSSKMVVYTDQAYVNQKVEPGQEYTFHLKMKAEELGRHTLTFNLLQEDAHNPSKSKNFDSQPLELTVTATAPVTLQAKAQLKWKNKFSGDYVLTIAGALDQIVKTITLDSMGHSKETEARSLIPEQTYDFTLKKPFYKAKTIHQKVIPGTNVLDFGELQPDIPSAILNPTVLWDLLPVSN